MLRNEWVLALALVLIATGAQAGCPLPSEVRMTIVTLYFGESIAGKPALTPRQWAEFAARIITPAFPDGFTISDGQGQWRDPGSGAILRENSKILTVAVAPSPGLAAKIQAVTTAYDRLYDQQSVGITTTDSCGEF
jgi:hypothetical protein